MFHMGHYNLHLGPKNVRSKTSEASSKGSDLISYVRDVDEMSAGDVGKEEEGAQKVGNRSHTERDRVHPTVHDP